jgi:TetR/AcrR family transcriptional regulator, regulator of autoinduction and epiphytic fitness
VEDERNVELATLRQPAQLALDRQPPTDGRVARSHRTVEHILRALLELVERDGHLRPTAHQVARRAGVSRRGLYLHFESIEDLFVLATERRVREAIASWREPSPDTPLDHRIDWFCRQWATLVEVLNPVRRAAAVQEPFSHQIRTALERARRWTEMVVERVFAPELDACSEQDRVVLLTALHHATSWSGWGDRRYQGVGSSEASRAMRRLLRALLAPIRTSREAGELVGAGSGNGASGN